MSNTVNIPELLRKEASELLQLQEQAEWAQTKAAAVSELINGGLPPEVALTKIAELENQHIKQASTQINADFSHYSLTLTKSAALIEQLQAKIGEIESENQALRLEKQAGVREILSKRGLGTDEINNVVNSVPHTTLIKAAGVSPDAPMDFGRSTDTANNADVYDPITRFSLGLS
jgi:hypothetical protein